MLSSLEKPFRLYVSEKGSIALEVLTQSLGPTQALVGYLSKFQDPVARERPHCLRKGKRTNIYIYIYIYIY
jgi:hypothetical protein